MVVTYFRKYTIQKLKMADKAILEFEGKKYEFPVFTGSEDEKAIDIKTLRSTTGGLTTIDPGYKNTGSCVSAITFLNGEEGILRYRGYSIEELADKADFLEVAYLLIFGELPTSIELEKFHKDIKANSHVDEDIKKILDGFPKTAHPMGVLSSLTSALIAFSPKPVNVGSGDDMYNAVVNIMGKFPVLVAWALRKRTGQPLDYGDDSLGYVDNILKMMFKKANSEYKIDPVVSNALDKLLILHADHEQNCSTSTVRIVGSSHAGLFASLSAGISALWGPLHGGANQAVLEMLEAIKEDGGDTKKYMAKAKDKEDPFRLMGFGHRVYKNFDPRAKIIKVAADEVLDALGVDDPILAIAKGLEKEALEDPYFVDRKLYPNVDFYSGIIYRAMGIPVEMFTVMFALGRLPGWIAQWKEMRENKEPIGRPRQVYIGENLRPFKDVSKR
ncbi:MAG: citrate synthase [Rubritalea sp.]|jgi:citrate synthase